ncbi:type I restriction endonuclease subunit R [Phenylobacterium soli]|uniref:type I restriction endonuclease subunit R n=1 Tax=Phenylobacterium soli TaxID=2170551 RepID=UPI0014036C9D|nr:type I restriction endonuclease subunit R [Phenylobacterium soli]
MKAGTDAYDLKQAVSDGFLVPPKAIDVPLKFPRAGIRYDDLTDDEKDEWDALDWGEDGPPDSVDAADVNDWLFNINTVDQMLKQLMEDGLKVAGGDRLGKTIIFAKNHRHAEFIVERFDANYPAFKGHFCRLIDNQVRYAHALIEDFEVPEKTPHIAVSVDMLDTGIDIPDVLNLVFFKIVRSKSKFWQMIGRGTRLREGIFVDADGNRSDKEYFYVFDYLGNLDFFNAQMEGAEAAGEVARRRLRGLMSLIEPGKQVVVTTNVADVMGAKREVELLDLGGASSLAQFRRKARAYVDAHADHVTLVRLRQGRPLTPTDLDELQKLFLDAGLAGTEEFDRIRKMPDLPDFVRSLVGLERRAALTAFNEALAGTALSPRQIHFVEMIVDYLTSSGKMDPAALYEPPFTDQAPNGISDIFDAPSVTRIVTTLESFEPRLEVAV